MAAMQYITAGESHGPQLTAIVSGVPAGLMISEEQINSDLARRQSGYGRGGRMAIETDTVKVASGIRFGRTLGTPISLVIEIGRIGLIAWPHSALNPPAWCVR